MQCSVVCFFEFLTPLFWGAITFSIWIRFLWFWVHSFFVGTPETMESSPWIQPALNTSVIAQGLLYPMVFLKAPKFQVSTLQMSTLHARWLVPGTCVHKTSIISSNLHVFWNSQNLFCSSLSEQSTLNSTHKGLHKSP